MEAILVDALGNQLLQGAARLSLLSGSRFIRVNGGFADLLAEPVTLASIYGRALFLAPLIPAGCFLAAHSAAWVWAGSSAPPETVYVASLRRPRRAADSRYWIQLDAPSRRRLQTQGILPLDSVRETPTSQGTRVTTSEGKNRNDFISLGQIKLLSPSAALRYCDQHPQLPGKNTWDRGRLITLSGRLLS